MLKSMGHKESDMTERLNNKLHFLKFSIKWWWWFSC